jgi:type VI secretion system protein VasI
MDDSKTITLSLDSGNVIQGPVGPSRPTLVIRCKENKTDVYVVTGMAASVEDDNLSDISPNHHTVRLRLDQASPQTAYWYGSNDDKALFAGDGEELAKELAESQTLTFEFTPFDANTAVARFDLTGLSARLPKVADACGWSLN